MISESADLKPNASENCKAIRKPGLFVPLVSNIKNALLGINFRDNKKIFVESLTK